MLIVSNCERYGPNRQGGRVLIRCVPEAEHVPDEKNSGKSLTVEFNISSSVEKNLQCPRRWRF